MEIDSLTSHRLGEGLDLFIMWNGTADKKVFDSKQAESATEFECC
jgi:hypothetical protein